MNGERFSVTYHLQGNAPDARARAGIIGYEQTVELPADLIPAGRIRDEIVGQVEHFAPAPNGGFTARIRYAIETSAFELTQLLNVMFGNTSLQPGIRVVALQLGAALLRHFPGPRFGIAGLRQRLDVTHRPLLCAALKPMGLSAPALAK
jgi:ribulose-bisphosphate carboxylase large chain